MTLIVYSKDIVYRFFRRQGLISGLFFKVRDWLCPIDFLLPHIPSQGTLLDLGCGLGVFATSFAVAKPELQILGVDIEHKRILKAQQIASPISNLQFREGQVENLLQDEQFDCITMIDVIHHLPRPLQAPLIHWAYTHVRPGGRLIIKEIDSHPRWMLKATQLHDLLRFPKHRTAFLSPEDLLNPMKERGLQPSVTAKLQRIYLPHILYIFEKPHA